MQLPLASNAISQGLLQKKRAFFVYLRVESNVERATGGGQRILKHFAGGGAHPGWFGLGMMAMMSARFK